MSGGRHASMESLVHQMAAQSVGHMDEGRPRTGGGQWFARLVSATCRALAQTSRPGPEHLFGRALDPQEQEGSSFHVARGYAAAVDCTRRTGVLRTWPDRCQPAPPAGGRICSKGALRLPQAAPDGAVWGATCVGFGRPPPPRLLFEVRRSSNLQTLSSAPLHILTCPVHVWQVSFSSSWA